MVSYHTMDGHLLAKQWRNPSDVTSLLMVIGGDVVQKALAAGTGSRFTPVCFSFGWVAYAFVALINMIGDGRLMPDPDCQVKLINLGSGYTRENKSWALGRFVRDYESRFARESHQQAASATSSSHATPVIGRINTIRPAIRITVYRQDEEKKCNKSDRVPLTYVHIIGALCILLQLGIAAIPIGLTREWDVMMIAVSGTVLAQLAGSLPQWKIEKTPGRVARKGKAVALTRGNGSQDVIVIIGSEDSWDLEAFASPQNPRTERIWESHHHTQSGQQNSETAKLLPRLADIHFGIPIGYWITLAVVLIQPLLWLAVLVNVTAERGNNWYLIAIGVIGVFQNAYVAGMERDETQLKLHLTKESTIEAPKVMDGLMDFEVKYKLGKHLLAEFFNGGLRPNESLWWNDERDNYDTERNESFKQNPSKRTQSLNVPSTMNQPTGVEGTHPV